MSVDQKAGVEPLQVGGYDIEVTLTADHFWFWERKAEAALEAVSSDPPKAVQLLQQVAHDMARRHALARKDDPNLPGYYRKFLP